MKSLEINQNAYDYKTWQVMQEYLPKESLNAYKNHFNQYDPDQTGVIKTEDVAGILKTMGYNFSVHELQELLRTVVGKDGFQKLFFDFVDFEEYIAIVSIIVTDCISEDEMHLVFRQFDRDGDGFITAQELTDLLLRLGDDITEKEIEEMIREADQDGDGRVSYTEFVQVMTNSVASTQDDTAAADDNITLCPAEEYVDAIQSIPENELLSQSQHSLNECSSDEENNQLSIYKQHSQKRRYSWLSGLQKHKKKNQAAEYQSNYSRSDRQSCPAIVTPFQNSSHRRHSRIHWKNPFTKQFSVSSGALFIRNTFKKIVTKSK